MDRRREVRETYDRIAGHFAKTRPQPWQTVDSFLANRSGETGLDIGVGNGRHAESLADVVDRVVGLDISRAALGTALDRSRAAGFDLDPVTGDAVSLPIRSSCIDLSVFVAAIHHLPDRDLRITSLDELDRVLRDSGTGIVSAWSITHDRFDATSGHDTTVDWTLPDGETVPRFYHIYDPEEFTADIEASRLRLVERFDSSGNCYAIVAPGTPES